MAVVLSVLDDEELLLPARRACWQKEYIANKCLGMQHQLYRELLVSDTEEYRRLQVSELPAQRPEQNEGKTTKRSCLLPEHYGFVG